MKFICIILYALVIWFVSGLEDDRDDWIDPNDMLNYDPSTNKMLKKEKMVFAKRSPVDENTDINPEHTGTDTNKYTQDTKDNQSDSNICPVCESCRPCPDSGSECPSCPTCKCDSLEVGDKAAMPLLKRYIHSILDHMQHELPGSGTQDYIMHISLSASQVTILESFIKGGNQKHVHDVHEVLSGMVSRVVSSRLSFMEKTALWMEDKIGLKLDRLVQFFLLSSLASVVLLIELKLQIPWGRRISQLIVLMFVISIPWTWFELYKQAEIKQHTMASKSIPSECSKQDQDIWRAIKSYFTFQDDKCHEYYEYLLIDPLIKVPPTKAIGVTFVRFFVAPLKDVGSAISEFIRALLIDLPLPLYPVAIVMVFLFFFMFLFMWFGYSIRLPFLLTIERSPALLAGNNQLHQAIEENSRQTLAQLAKLQSHLDVTEKQISDRLQNLQQVQQAAIEYNCSHDGSFPSPSLPGSRSGASVALVAPPSPPASPTKHSNIPKLSNNIQKSPSHSKASKEQAENYVEGQKSRLAPVSRSSPRKHEARLVRSCDSLGADGESKNDLDDADLESSLKKYKENMNEASDSVSVETVGCEDCTDHELD